MKKWLGTFLQGDEGAMLVEYALLLTTIAAACAAVVSALGSAAGALWAGSGGALFVAL
ncbi:MAG: hypothetical protein ACLQNE_10955 [Thermoguttaceae bacterium]